MGRWDQYLYNKRIGNASAAEGALQGERVPPAQPARSHLHRGERRRAARALLPDPQLQGETPRAGSRRTAERGAEARKTLLADEETCMCFVARDNAGRAK